jgi:RHH-type rel operon transcriptional repressor/antitoxin RelB
MGNHALFAITSSAGDVAARSIGISLIGEVGCGINIGEVHTMLSVPLNPDIERRLSELSKRTGRSESDFARELIEGNIEDLEDRYLAERAIKEGGPRLTSEQVRKELGLEH